MKKRGPCKHAEVFPNKAGVIVIRQDMRFPCRCPIPDVTNLLPTSVVKSYGFQWPPVRNPHTDKSMCAKCPCFEPREVKP